MVVLYALLCLHLNSTEIKLLEVIEHSVVGNSFSTDAEICKIPPPAVTVSFALLCLEDHVAPQNLLNDNMLRGGGSVKVKGNRVTSSSSVIIFVTQL